MVLLLLLTCRTMAPLRQSIFAWNSLLPTWISQECHPLQQSTKWILLQDTLDPQPKCRTQVMHGHMALWIYFFQNLGSWIYWIVHAEVSIHLRSCIMDGWQWGNGSNARKSFDTKHDLESLQTFPFFNLLLYYKESHVHMKNMRGKVFIQPFSGWLRGLGYAHIAIILIWPSSVISWHLESEQLASGHGYGSIKFYIQFWKCKMGWLSKSSWRSALVTRKRWYMCDVYSGHHSWQLCNPISWVQTRPETPSWRSVLSNSKPLGDEADQKSARPTAVRPSTSSTLLGHRPQVEPERCVTGVVLGCVVNHLGAFPKTPQECAPSTSLTKLSQLRSHQMPEPLASACIGFRKGAP